MSSAEAGFRAALLDADQPAPQALRDGAGRPAGRRFDVYRNNVAVSLTEALAEGFPVVAKLLGPENFKAVAGVFLRRSPPDSPLLMIYGAAFPAFLRGFEPLAHLGYLGDVAALEMALRRAYHAADHQPLAADALGRFTPQQLERLRLGLAPSLQLVRSPWPVLAIWIYNNEGGAPKPRAGAQEVLVARVGFDPAPHLLPAGGGGFVAALQKGARLGEAAAATLEHHPEFDLGAVLTLLLDTRAITSATP
ncbi:putative DNA-binding domain-containing protein [Shimia sp.]|uniref:HvfC/BufC family peptide modification chaperone n=1 Tax=Shimia sp. TaxID=1954381 RepID=UPI003568E359